MFQRLLFPEGCMRARIFTDFIRSLFRAQNNRFRPILDLTLDDRPYQLSSCDVLSDSKRFLQYALPHRNPAGSKQVHQPHLVQVECTRNFFRWGKGGIVSTEDEAERTVGEDNLCVSGNRKMLPSLIILPNENEGVLCLPPPRKALRRGNARSLSSVPEGKDQMSKASSTKDDTWWRKTYCTQMIAHHADSNVGGTMLSGTGVGAGQSIMHGSV
ncbi:hypothetical protein TNCV_4040211 [Trichonephila clavipes]|nr:hypothetical protein TNCV_4040211 [Trichonephila clavipes]